MSFRLGDVHIPKAQQVMHDLFKDEVLYGRVVEMVSNGMMGETFVIVQVEKLTYYLIVPLLRTNDV